MKASGAWVMGGLAAASMAAAYLTWQREPEDTASTATVLDVSRRDLESVRYEDPTKWIELTRRPEGGDEAVWVTSGTKTPPDAGTTLDAGMSGDGGTSVDAGTLPDGGVPPAPLPPRVPPKTPDRQLVGNEVAERLFQKFAPLLASRALGVIETGKLEELGLKTPSRSLDVRFRGGEEKYDVGTPAMGVSTPYLRDPKDGKVYLLAGGVISDFDMGSGRLVDRRLHEFTSAEYDGIKVSANNSTREYSLVAGANPMLNTLVQKGTQSADAFAKNWHDKVWRSSAFELLGKGELPPGGEPKPHFRVDYFRGSKNVGFFEAAPVGTDVYARTEHTASWVKLQPGGEGLLIEADRVTSPERK